MKLIRELSKRKSVAGLLMTVGVAVAIFAIACGGTETVEVTRIVKETVIVEKVVEKEVEVEKVVEKAVEVVVTATASSSDAMMAPTEQSGTLVAALQSVGSPIGTPELCVPNCANEKYFFSAWDTLLQWTSEATVGPGIAESWDLAPDQSKFTWHVRPGIQFHKGWGEVTADDVAFSTNSVNSNTNPDSVHDVAGDMSCCYGETIAVDKYTAETAIITYDSRAPGWLFTNLRDAYGISSKTIYDEYGKEGMREILVGTGPFEVREWLEKDRLVLDAIPEHYRKTASYETARIIEVPEEASRIAMFESGDATITHVSLPNVQRLVDSGGTKRLLENVITHIGMNPNFLEKTNPKTGEPLENPGYDDALANADAFPWVSYYNLPGSDCDWDVLLEEVPSGPICPEMENGRKVRLAMAKAIDKAALVKGLLDDLGSVACNWAISTTDPTHDDAWCIDYDPEGAKQLMIDSGNEDGFKIGIWAGNEPSEVHQAVAGMWLDTLNIEVEFHLGPFQVWQPTFVDRSFQHLVFDGEQGGMPAHYAKGREAQAWFAGGIMWSGGIPFYQRIYGGMLSEPDEQKRNDLARQFANHERFWHWDPAIWEQPIFTIYNGSDMEWNPTSLSIHTQISNYVYPLEDITLK